MKKNTLLGNALAITLSSSAIAVHAQMGAECVSVGGSTADTEDAGGFCLVSDSDLIGSTTGPANFAVANDLPVAGLQFIQATFRDGSTVSGSRSFSPGSDTPIGVECVSVDGSTVAAASGFCLASDLGTSTAGFANFAVANDLPLAGMQFLQVTFGVGAPLDGSGPAECVSVDGSSAATGNAGGFCLASDLSTSTTDFMNFAVANELPVAGLQFLQVAFGDSPLGESTHAECVSVDGSTAVTGNAGGSCLASDFSTLTTDFANFSLANDLPVAGLQFLQIIFGDGNQDTDAPMVAECVSVGGSTAVAGNDGGFCLASDVDLGASTTGFATFSVANNLPAADLKLVQVTFVDGSPLGGLFHSPDADTPVVVVSNSVRLPLRYPSAPAVAGLPGDQPRHFHVVGDLNDDSCADREDFNIMIADIRGGEPFNLSHDLNGDGITNRADARTLVGLFTNPGGAPCG